MKKNYIVLIPVLVAAVVFSGCGKNEKKQSLITGLNTGIVASSGGGVSSTASSMALQSANMVRIAGSAAKAFSAPRLSPSFIPSMPQDTDGDGWYEYTGITGSEIEIQFTDSSGKVVPIISPLLRYINIKVTSAYTYGSFSGSFQVDTQTDMMTGSITSADPIGGTFTAQMTLTMEDTTINGQPAKLPVSGSMTLSGSSGYAGTFIFAKSDGTFTCTGTITENGEQVASVSLTFNQAFGNYTGSYTDLSGTHAII